MNSATYLKSASRLSRCVWRVVSKTSSARVSTRAMASPPASFKLLQYDYVPDILEKRAPFREGHLAAAQKFQEADKLVMAGAYGDPVEGGMFVFKNASDEEITQYVKDDPYFQNDLITGWSIKPYMVAIGGQ